MRCKGGGVNLLAVSINCIKATNCNSHPTEPMSYWRNFNNKTDTLRIVNLLSAATAVYNGHFSQNLIPFRSRVFSMSLAIIRVIMFA